ncbi:MAG: DUF5684 domain-containing protein [Pseudobutyrivibrio sp.]|nr:DUF5684 domain-containing protein [Pseudobutyrivibrio sp.]
MKTPFIFLSLLIGMTNSMGGFISIVLLLMNYIGLWHMFEKAGEDGWRCIVPFYNTYMIGEICGKEKLAKAIIVIEVITFVCLPTVVFQIIRTTNNLFFKDDMFSGTLIGFSIGVFILFITIVAKMILRIMLDYYFIKSYGAPTVFLLLAIFLPCIAWMILGLSVKYPYYGVYNPYYVNSYWRTNKV